MAKLQLFFILFGYEFFCPFPYERNAIFAYTIYALHIFREKCCEYGGSVGIERDGDISRDIVEIYYFDGKVFAHAQEKAAIWRPLNLSHVLGVHVMEFVNNIESSKLSLTFRRLVHPYLFTNCNRDKLGVRRKLHCCDSRMEIIVCYNFLSLERHDDCVPIFLIVIPLSTAIRSNELGEMQMEPMLLLHSGGSVYVQLLYKRILFEVKAVNFIATGDAEDVTVWDEL